VKHERISTALSVEADGLSVGTDSFVCDVACGTAGSVPTGRPDQQKSVQFTEIGHLPTCRTNALEPKTQCNEPIARADLTQWLVNAGPPPMTYQFTHVKPAHDAGATLSY
jgi:hypothetical protein